jgi:cysteine desulfuration protein SufE
MGQRRPCPDHQGRRALSELSAGLDEIVEEFGALGEQDRLLLLLEYSRELPEPPARLLAAGSAALERVPECQSPVFLAVEVDEDPERTVRVYFQAPPEAPTTRGFAGILHEALDGRPAAEVLGVPGDLGDRLGLSRAVSPLRLRGLSGMLTRIQRRVRAETS